MPENQKRLFSLVLEVLGYEIELRQGQRLINANDFITKINGEPLLAERFAGLLEILNSTYDFPIHYGPEYDGLLINHPQLGSRVIEFDEEQHFTPHRIKSIELFKEYLPFSEEYKTLFIRNNVRERSLRKHMIYAAVDVNIFRDLEETTSVIREYGIIHTNNKYIRPTSGFNYPGGRLAQRAVYDLMKDLYYVIKPDYKPIIRFSIFEFEVMFDQPFNHCSDEQINSAIREKLRLFT